MPAPVAAFMGALRGGGGYRAGGTSTRCPRPLIPLTTSSCLSYDHGFCRKVPSCRPKRPSSTSMPNERGDRLRRRDTPPRALRRARCHTNGRVNRLEHRLQRPALSRPPTTRPRAATHIIGDACMPSANCFCPLWTPTRRVPPTTCSAGHGGQYLVSISAASRRRTSQRRPARVATDEDRIEFRYATRARGQEASTGHPPISRIVHAHGRLP